MSSCDREYRLDVNQPHMLKAGRRDVGGWLIDPGVVNQNRWSPGEPDAFRER